MLFKHIVGFRLDLLRFWNISVSKNLLVLQNRNMHVLKPLTFADNNFVVKIIISYFLSMARTTF